jgi:hypothetical protein
MILRTRIVTLKFAVLNSKQDGKVNTVVTDCECYKFFPYFSEYVYCIKQILVHIMQTHQIGNL